VFIGRQFGTKAELDVEVEVNGTHAHLVVLGTEAEGVEQLHQLKKKVSDTLGVDVLELKMFIRGECLDSHQDD
jgi:hypothetical protein